MGHKKGNGNREVELCEIGLTVTAVARDKNKDEPLRRSVALNLPSAGTLQFPIGQTSDSAEKQNTTITTSFNANITIFYGRLISPYDTACSNWSPFRTITSLSGNSESASYVIPLSSAIRQLETCVRWSVQLPGGPSNCPVVRPTARWSVQLPGGPSNCPVVRPTARWSVQLPGGPSNCPVVRPTARWSVQLPGGPSNCPVVRPTARWSVQLPGEDSHVCFAIDDVAVTKTADDRPLELHTDFDPLSTADWLSLFANTSRTKCRVVVKGVQVQALMFNSNHIGPSLGIDQRFSAYV
ncbi:uncharacterized protein LOC132088334 [Daphnia carinata]|uniref:uncharacterized protein LOC132088334 n=1 Tax=Daphnia carinata TaxID=120202 RepID=UPI002868502E|nr:uncharacterized protein LOC132088334 [Daphnia carinata]